MNESGRETFARTENPGKGRKPEYLIGKEGGERVSSKDLYMLQHPELWIQPVLPLVKRKQFKAAILIPGKGPTLYLGNMFSLTSLDDALALPKVEYASFEDILNDGWEVD